MSKNDPHHIPKFNGIPSLPLDEDLVLVLNLASKAAITPHMNEWERTLTIMNKGLDKDLVIERNGNLVVVTQSAFSSLKNGPRPDVGILVPYKFQRLVMNLSGSAEVTGSAFPHATVIRTKEHAAVTMKTHDCFAHLTENTEAKLTIEEGKVIENGRVTPVNHDLVLASWSNGYTTIEGDIGKAYILVANRYTARNLATINEAHIFTPADAWSNEYIATTGLMHAVHEKGLSLNGLQRKTAQMRRGFNACVRSKAAARL